MKKRSKPMKRQPSAKQVAKLAAAKPTRIQWENQNEFCWATAQDQPGRFSLSPQYHHIAGRTGPESEDPANWAALSAEYHAIVHASSRAALPVVLALKWIYDNPNYDREFVLTLLGFSPDAITQAEVNILIGFLSDEETPITVAELIEERTEQIG